jgi:hypothetical protein
MMAIVNIKHSLLRRCVLVLAIVPVCIIAMLWRALRGGAEVLREAPDAFRIAWRGR